MVNEYKKYKAMLEVQERKVDSSYPICRYVRVLPMDSDRRVHDEQMRYLQLLCSKESK